MTIKDFWKHALGDFLHVEYTDISVFEGKRFAVDASIFLNKYLRTEVDKIASTCSPPYAAVDLLQSMMEFHETISKWITPYYVFDGIAPELKAKRRLERQKLREHAGKRYLDMLQKALEEENTSYAEEELQAATESRMKMAHPTHLDHAALVQWMRSENILCIGSLGEADQQMVQLEKDGVVDGIISEDGDEVALGARLLLTKISRKSNGEYQFKVFEREKLLRPDNPYNSKLCAYPSLITDVALLLGNDYIDRVDGNGPAAVLGSFPKEKKESGGGQQRQQRENSGSKKRKRNNRGKTRLDNGMLDQMARSPNKLDWLAAFGAKGKGPLTSEAMDQYQRVYRYMRHAPVLTRCSETQRVTVIPLNELPEGETDLFRYLGSDFGLGHPANSDDDLLSSIYNCEVLPLERKPLAEYSGRLSTALFEVLDFNAVPIAIQPKMCLVNWLRARRVDVLFSDPRSDIEKLVVQRLQQNKPAQPPRLKPILVQDGFGTIRPRVASNEYDNWCSDYLSVANRLEVVTDDVIDRLLGKKRFCRPSIRKRVGKLISGGCYHPREMKCRNMESKRDGTACILICCPCLSSKTKVIHTIYAVFEDQPRGKYLRRLSSCSCRKGAHFCSHSIGFLHLLAILQQRVISQSDFEDNWRVSPHLVQGVPMLIENVVVKDTFNRQKAQRKRQSKRRNPNPN